MEAKSLFYQLFGVGKIPENLMLNLQQEGILLLEEGVNGSVTYQNFRAPGRYARWKRQWLIASIVVTNVRLLAVSFSNPIINIPLADRRIHMMKFSLEKSGVCVAFDPSLFHADWSGTIEYRFHTSKAQQLLEFLKQGA